MGKIIGIVSGKGGVGKTTTALILASFLSHFGKDVLVVDANISSPDIAQYMNLKSKKTLQKSIIESGSLVEAVFPHESGIKFILGDEDIELLPKINVFEIEEAIRELSETSEIIILDGPPGINEESLTVVKASDDVIVVTNNDAVSIKQAKRMLEACKKLKAHVLGIIIVENIPHKKVDLREVEKYFETIVLGTIPYDKKINLEKGKYIEKKMHIKNRKLKKSNEAILSKIGLLEKEHGNKLIRLFFGKDGD